MAEAANTQAGGANPVTLADDQLPGLVAKAAQEAASNVSKRVDELLASATKSIEDRLAAIEKAARTVEKPSVPIGEKVPATPKVYGTLKAFKSAETAYDFGAWFAATMFKYDQAVRHCRNKGLVHEKDLVGNVNSAGGYLVPEEFANELVNLKEQYSVARQAFRVIPMTRDTMPVPLRTGGFTAYFPGEGGSITESNLTFAQSNLVAKKMAVLTQISTELNEDAFINMGDLIADEIAYAFGKKLDECCFLGDSTATYGHIEGLTGVIKRQVSDTGGTWATDDDHERSAACINLTGNLFSEALITDFEKAIGLLPNYADNERTAWYCHKTFWANAMVRLALASSGNATENFANGVRKTFMGYPVVITQAMPTQADDTVVCFLGDLRQVGWIGDRREMRIGISEHYAFNSDLVTIKGTERVDFVCVDQGTPNSTPASIAATDRPGWIGLATIS